MTTRFLRLTRLTRLSLALAAAPVALVFLAPEAHAATAAPAADAKAAKRHPLKGVVSGVMADQSALMVKHEEVPGVMRAMTMMFKVDAATLESVKKGDAITGLMAREAGEWRLHEVQVVPAKKN